MRQRAKQPRLRVIAPYSFCFPQVEQMSHPKRPRDPKRPVWRLRHNTAPFSQQGRAVAANSTFRWSHFAYAISWRTSSSVCASLISDRHRELIGLSVAVLLLGSGVWANIGEGSLSQNGGAWVSHNVK